MDSVHDGDFSLEIVSGFVEIEDFLNLLRRQFGPSFSDGFLPSESPVRVREVLPSRNIFKILGAIVIAYAIFVIPLQPFGARSKKSVGDQNVDVSLLGKWANNCIFAGVINPLLQNSSGFEVSNPPKAASFVSPISHGDWLPNFDGGNVVFGHAGYLQCVQGHANGSNVLAARLVYTPPDLNQLS